MMAPAARLRLAELDYRHHAATCTRCQPVPALDKAAAGCPVGDRRERAWLAAWRDTVRALSGRPT